MTSTHSSRNLWDACRVLDLYPNDPNFSCVGIASSTNRRCRWTFDTDQFRPSQKATVVASLRSMSQKHPAEITTAALDALARNMLCRDFHQRQASARSYEWRRRIESYLREQEELLERDLETEQLRALLDESNAGFKEAMAAVRKTEKKIDSLDKRAKASERDLHQQVEASSCEVAVLLEAKASSDEKARLSGMEAESARQKSQASNARYEALEAKMSKDSKRKLEKVNQDLAKRDQHIEQLLEQKEELKHELAERDHDVQQLVEQKEGLKQQLAERDQDVQQLVEQKEGLKQKLVERDQDVQQLMEQKEGMKQKVVERDQDVQQLVEQKKELKQVLAEREDKLSSLLPRNVKRGLFAVISRQPPRILVRKISKIMKKEPTPYVQSAA